MGYDPAGFDESNPSSFNRYGYGNNNPYTFVDPDGRTPVHAFMAMAYVGTMAVARFSPQISQWSQTARNTITYVTNNPSAVLVTETVAGVASGVAMPGTAAPGASVRQGYKEAVAGLKATHESLLVAGKSEEMIARTLSAERREIGERFKALTPADELSKIYDRNLGLYGDKLGPTVDFLRSQGKSWTDIIDGALRTGGKDLGY